MPGLALSTNMSQRLAHNAVHKLAMHDLTRLACCFAHLCPHASLILVFMDKPSHRSDRQQHWMVSKQSLTAEPAWLCRSSQDASQVWQSENTWGQSS